MRVPLESLETLNARLDAAPRKSSHGTRAWTDFDEAQRLCVGAGNSGLDSSERVGVLLATHRPSSNLALPEL